MTRQSIRLTVSSMAIFICVSAVAQNPVFSSAIVSGVNNDGSITVSWEEDRLGSFETVQNIFRAPRCTATWACLNVGTNTPQGTNKQQTITSFLSDTATIQPDHGRIVASLSMGPLLPTFSCPSGQTLALANITYSDIEFSDTTSSLDAALNTTSISRVFFPLTK
jgi:hypothetical protein